MTTRYRLIALLMISPPVIAERVLLTEFDQGLDDSRPAGLRCGVPLVTWSIKFFKSL